MAVWVFNSKSFCFKSCIYRKKAENGLFDRSQTWDRIVEIFLDFWTARGRPETDVDCYVGIYALSSILVFIRPEMGKKFGSKK